MPEPMTYYSRDGKDYAVFAYDLIELYALSVSMGDLTSQDVWDAIRHLEGSQRRGRIEPTTKAMDPDKEEEGDDDAGPA